VKGAAKGHVLAHGFRCEGPPRRSPRIHGAWRDRYLSAVLADEWPRPAAAGAGD
jgi:hypothetical protein